MKEAFFGERQALCRLVVQGMLLDVKHVPALARLPLDTLRDIKEQLGLVWATDPNWIQRLTECQGRHTPVSDGRKLQLQDVTIAMKVGKA